MKSFPRTAPSCALVFFGVAAACGARTGLPVGQELPLGPDGCQETGLPLVPRTPNIYFILDRSGSMSEMNKWVIVREDIAGMITSLGTHANFGAAEFPTVIDGTSQDLSAAQMIAQDCEVGTQVMPPRLGDGLSSAQAGSTAAAFLAATVAPPFGGTPTAATFLALTPELASLPGYTFAILATDGGPNCNLAPGLTCSVADCTADLDGLTFEIDRMPVKCAAPVNCCAVPEPGFPDGSTFDCLDQDRTVDAVAMLKSKGVPTYAIGLPSSEVYAATLDAIATAGGTGHYYPVQTVNGQADSIGLANALALITMSITESCNLTLEQRPSDPDQINVVLEGNIVPQSGANGWTLDGKIVTLFGEACGELQAPGVNAAVTSGCPTQKE
jgi:hypothetical protein